MLALLEALKHNSTSLREVHIHDNWIKGEAAERLVEFIYRARSLEKLNISDSDMGTENAYLVIKALHDSSSTRQSLKEFYCNFNEVTTAAINKQVLDTLLADFPSLAYVEYRGNTLGRKTKKDYVQRFQDASKKIVLFEEEDEDEEDDEEEEYDDEEAEFEEDDIVKRLENLKL